MTTTNKLTKRETLATYRGRPLVLELHGNYLYIRQKGRRTRYTVTYDQIYTLGARNQAEAERRERAERKKVKKRLTS